MKTWRPWRPPAKPATENSYLAILELGQKMPYFYTGIESS
jgi:hypothetical protein